MVHAVLAGLGTLAGLSLLFSGDLGSGVGERDLTAIRKAPAYQPSTQQSDLHQIPTPATASASQSPQQDMLRRLDALRQQEGILRQELADRSQQLQQRTNELEQAQADTDRLKQQIASLNQERQEAEAKRPAAELNERERQGREDVGLAPQKKASAKAKHPRLAKATQPPPPSPAQALRAARQWLAAGRPDEARRLLAMAQTEMVLQPVTPDQPDAQGISMNATAVGDAIRWLDRGATARAMQAMNWAIEASGEEHAWSGYLAIGYPPFSQPR